MEFFDYLYLNFHNESHSEILSEKEIPEDDSKDSIYVLATFFVELIRIVNTWGSLGNMTWSMPALLIMWSRLVKVFHITFNTRKVSTLSNRISLVWGRLQDQSNIEILHQITDHGRFIMDYINPSTCVYHRLPFVLTLFSILIHQHQPRVIELFFKAQYGIDKDDNFVVTKVEVRIKVY